jgi:hypothetical protein
MASSCSDFVSAGGDQGYHDEFFGAPRYYDDFFLIVEVSCCDHNCKSPIFYVGVLLPYHRVVIILTSTMMRPWTLRLGKGTRCNVLVKNLRPSREIKERILNPQPKQRVTDLLVTRQAILTRGKSTYEAILQ